MRLVPINSIVQGALLAKTIYNADGTALLRAGYPLYEHILNTSKKNGIRFLFVDDIYSDVLVNSVIDPELRKDALTTVKSGFEELYRLSSEKKDTSKKTGDVIQSMCALSNKFVDCIVTNKHYATHLVDIKDMSDNTYNHSVNTAILSTALTLKLGYSEQITRSVTLGTFMHDLGKIFIPQEILLKPGKLNKKEFKIIKQHPSYGYEYLKNQEGMDSIALSIIHQHHEKVNGSGYPSGLKGRDISIFAKIVSICDVYEALTNDRPYRKAVSPNEALELLMGSCGSEFDLNLVKAFIKQVDPYPQGSVVKLSNKRLAVIKRTNPKYILRPLVSMFDNDSTNTNFVDLDLMKRCDIVIEGPYNETINNESSLWDTELEMHGVS